MRYNNDMQAWQRRYTADTEHWRRCHAGCVRQVQNWKGQYRNTQNQIQNLNQNIFNLQQQIFILQNNAPVNIATIQLRHINELARSLAVAGFNAAMRANVMKNKMTGRFIPVPANNPYNENSAINTEAEFLNWLQGKYRDLMIGSNRAALKALMNEKFTEIDTPDT
ncbi:hypothetical protein RhiirA1_482062 [Rhizophagus irregularis]|uniref:Uncharacterized protein n=1 Tax=Rhizophagus irregularis TaxID=588596 RepID=A0A2N0QMB1_9GLOM|nr:hypothetical protein RhiirA1_482062 [Rhizophagus irregularis]